MPSSLPFLLFLGRKAQQAGPSNASLRYDAAHYSGHPATMLREKLRRCVREIFAFWLLGGVALMLWLDSAEPKIASDNHALEGLFFAAIFVLPVWLFYRVVRFALGR